MYRESFPLTSHLSPLTIHYFLYFRPSVKKILILSLLALTLQANAQNNSCNLNNTALLLREVFVFSENRNHTIMELFGEQVPQQLMSIMYIPNEERKKEIDELVLNGQLHNSIFIFPETTGVRRYCSPQEYAAYLKSEKDLPMNRNER